MLDVGVPKIPEIMCEGGILWLLHDEKTLIPLPAVVGSTGWCENRGEGGGKRAREVRSSISR